MSQSIQHVPANFDFYQPVVERGPQKVEPEDSLNLARYLDFLVDNRWMIAATAIIVTLLGVAYAFLATPIYETNILIQVEDGAGGSSVSSSGANKNIQGDLSGAFDIKTATASEIEVLRSRSVLARAVTSSGLFIDVDPNYFPVIGQWIARNNNELSTPGLFGYGSYVWGKERAQISTFNVPPALEGKDFTLTALDNDRFRLTLDDPDINIIGREGDELKVPTSFGDIELKVADIQAQPGAEFSVTRHSLVDTIEKLQNSLKIAEKGKQSGIIGVTLDGPDPQMNRKIVNEIGSEYIRQNVERKSEKAKKSLAFLDRELPVLKQQLEISEDKYKQFRKEHVVVDLSEQAKTLLQRTLFLQSEMTKQNQIREEMQTRYQDDYPRLAAVLSDLRAMKSEMLSIDRQMKELPGLEQELVHLSRDVKVNTDLYTTLLSTAQQLRLVTSSELGNARLLDHAALPDKPIKPKRLITVSIAGLIGLALGVAAAFLRKSLRGGIDAPHDIKDLLGLPVSVTIPHSISQENLFRQLQQKTKSVSVLADNAPGDVAIESLRGFRASLQYTMRDARNNVVMITSSTPGVGKTFVSVNFAAVLASVGKKVLLIDGDLRKGHLHLYFGLERENGLSDAILSWPAVDGTIRRNVVENVDLLTTGHLMRKPAELLAHENFGKLLQQLSSRYDLIMIDTAPVLPVADALVIGPHAGAVFAIVRAGVSTVGEIDETVKRLNQAGVTVTGTIFNDSRVGTSASRYAYGGYSQLQYVEKVS